MAFCGVEVLCLDRCVQKASEFLSLCSISTTASLVNKVHSVSQLAEMCVMCLYWFSQYLWAPCLIPCAAALCVCVRATWIPGYLWHVCSRLCVYCACTIHYNLRASVSDSLCMHACVYTSVCVRGAVFPGLLVIMFLGVMGGTWKPCAAQIKTNKEMMGAPLSPLWPGGPWGARTRD